MAEISAIQIFEDVPGIKKNIVPIDSQNLLEIWKPIPNRIMLTEDLEFIKKENERIESVVKKLIWLGDSWLNSEILEQKIKVETWEDVLSLIREYDYVVDFITIDFHPAKIVLEHSSSSGEPTEYWGVYPNCWDIYLVKIRTFNGGYIIDDYNTPYIFHIEAWAGIPFFRNSQTGELIKIEDLDRLQ